MTRTRPHSVLPPAYPQTSLVKPQKYRGSSYVMKNASPPTLASSPGGVFRHLASAIAAR